MVSKIPLILLTLLLIPAILAEGQRKAKTGPVPARKKSHPADSIAAAKPPVRADYGKYDFSYSTLDGKTIRLSDYAGKVVLVNIWAPWCGPCVRETPGFVKLYERYRKRGFEIIGVAVSTNRTAVRAFMDKYTPAWPIGIDDEVAVSFSTHGIPDNYLFNPDGSLIKRFVGYTQEEALQPLIETALKQTALNKPK